MARYRVSAVSQTAQPAGVPVTTTVNGYIGYWGAAAACGFRLRQVKWGLATTTTAAITAMQAQLAIYRQTAAPSGTGLQAAILGQAKEFWTPTDPTTGLIVTTASSIGTTGPTIAAQPIARIPLNDQNTWQDQSDGPSDETVCNVGTANGFAFVIIGQALPSLSFVVLDIEIEV